MSKYRIAEELLHGKKLGKLRYSKTLFIIAR
jgi:hypothetical protein